MTNDTVLHGLDLSYFTGKVQAYLQYAEVPHRFEEMSVAGMARAKAMTGLAQMPAVEMADGRWMTDSTAIIAWYDAQGTTTEPVTPRDGDSLPSRGPVAIRLRSRDNEDGLLQSWVEFDVDGDGSVDPGSEVFATAPAESPYPGTRVAILPQSSGAAGLRTLRVVAEDAWLNRTTREIPVRVTPPDTAAPRTTSLATPSS